MSPPWPLNGNQITITYAAGQSVTWNNSSSRIASINDVLGTYNFAYTLGWFPHLTTITSSYPAENYTFRYLPNANLLDLPRIAAIIEPDISSIGPLDFKKFEAAVETGRKATRAI